MGAEKMRLLERLLMLQIMMLGGAPTVMENEWLCADGRRCGVKSADAYKNAGYQQFQTLLETIKHDVAGTSSMFPFRESSSKAPQSPWKSGIARGYPRRQSMKVGRNDPPAAAARNTNIAVESTRELLVHCLQ